MVQCAAQGRLYSAAFSGSKDAEDCLTDVTIRDSGGAEIRNETGGIRNVLRLLSSHTDYHDIVSHNTSIAGSPGAHGAVWALLHAGASPLASSFGSPSATPPAGSFSIHQHGIGVRLTVTKEGNVGIGVPAPNARLDVAGAIKIGTASTCNANTEGSLRYNTIAQQMEFCNGSTWRGMDSSTSGWCGAKILNSGNRSSHQINGSAATQVIPCEGHDPQTSCPSGYSRLNITSVAWHDDSIADSVFTCVSTGSGTSGGGSGGGGGPTSVVPSGAVMAFDLSACPSGWSPVTAAQGRFIVGTGTLGSDSYGLGATGGEAQHSLTIAEMPAHEHGIGTYGLVSAAGGNVYGLHGSYDAGTYTKPSGGGQPHENRPPYLALLYCKKN